MFAPSRLPSQLFTAISLPSSTVTLFITYLQTLKFFRIFLLSNFDTKWQLLPLTVLSHFRCSHFASVLLLSVEELRSTVLTKSQHPPLIFNAKLNAADSFLNFVHSGTDLTVTFLRDIRFAYLHAELIKQNDV